MTRPRCCGSRSRSRRSKGLPLRKRFAGLTLLTLLCGCREEDPVTRARRTFHEKQQSRFAAATMETALFTKLSGDRMVRANQKDGLGLAIRAAKTELRVGEPLRVLLVYENLAAKGDVSATTCQGFSLTVEDETSGQTSSTEMHQGCPKTESPDVALRVGQLRTLELEPADTKLTFDHPGRYLAVASWQSRRLADPVSGQASDYALLRSNPQLITVR